MSLNCPYDYEIVQSRYSAELYRSMISENAAPFDILEDAGRGDIGERKDEDGEGSRSFPLSL